MHHIRVTKKQVLIVAVLAGVIYNIWPLGYILDSSAMHNSYLSVLQATGRPYNWLFILGDVVTGLLAILVSLYLLRRKPVNWTAGVSYMVFSITNIIDAVLPISNQCNTSISQCGIAPSQIFATHDIFSVLSYLGIFVSLLVVMHKDKQPPQSSLIKAVYYIYCLAGCFLALSIVIDQLTTVSQGIFTAAIGVGLVAVPLALLKEQATET